VQRLESEVSVATGLVGALSLTILISVAIAADIPLVAATFLLLSGTALPMIIWTIGVEKVHLRQSTGLDFSIRRSAAEVWPLTWVKLIGLGATLALIGLGYFSFKFYAGGEHAFYFGTLYITLPALLLLAPSYISFINRHMVEPHDGLWHFGKLVCLDFDIVDTERVKDHLRSWAIKGFFLAFMMSIFPSLLAGVLHFNLSVVITNPIEGILFLIRVMFLFDVCFGTIGYILTMRPLDTHIRSANPYLAGWVAALICYPPFTLMGGGGPLDYRAGTQEWTTWFAGLDAVLLFWGLAIVALTLVYAWATVIFGIRFSNLTHRGIITNGPYRYFKHPAYLSKNIVWWLTYLPFFSTTSSTDALRNSLLLLTVNGVYYVRAKTEEMHLMIDPRYQAYSEWIAENGVLERLFAGLRRRWHLSRGRPVVPAGKADDARHLERPCPPEPLPSP